LIKPQLLKAFSARYGQNEKIVNDFMSNPEMRNMIVATLLDEIYKQSRL